MINAQLLHDKFDQKCAPEISVLTTTFNREDYLEDCILSVLDSSFQNFELIIVDDVSSDSSVEIAMTFARKDPRIRVYKNDQNLGDYKNRNVAASLARGQYIKYLDADDMIARFALEILFDSMEKHPSACCGFADSRDVTGVHPVLLKPSESYDNYYGQKIGLFDRSPLSVIIRREAFERIGGFSGRRNVGDFELWHLLARDNNVLVIPFNLGFWRTHEAQESVMNRTDPIVPLRYLLLSREFLNMAETPMISESKAIAIQEKQRRIARLILRASVESGWFKCIQMKNEAKLSWKAILQNAFLS